MPARNLMIPGSPPRIDVPDVFRGLRRAFVLAPSLAILLILAAAGAASAADDLDLLEAAPVAPVVKTVDPKTTVAPAVAELAPVAARLVPVKRNIVKTLAPVVPDGSAQRAKAIVRGVERDVRSVAPLPIPAATPRDLGQGLGDIIEPRPPQPPAAEDPELGVAPPPAFGTFLVPTGASAVAASRPSQLDGTTRLRPFESGAPLGLVDPAGTAVIGGSVSTAAIGGSGSGPGPWLRNGSWPRVQPFRWTGFPAGIPFAMPRGLTPGPVVPPG